MNKKLAVLAVGCTLVIIISGFQSTMLYGTEYMHARSGYIFSVSASVDWWDCNWSYCKEIRIDHTKVQDNQINFPVLLYEPTDSDLAAHAQSDGDDIAFVHRYNSTQFKHEIEKFDSSTGELWAWVNVTSVSSTKDTIFYMYYGNPTCSSQGDASGTWGPNYLMVQHLDESAGTLYDSTSFNNDGTNDGATYNTNSKIQGGYDFDGTDNITCDHDGSLNITNAITLEGWVKDPPWLKDNTKTEVKIVDKRDEKREITHVEDFIVERTISANIEIELTFVALFSTGIKIKDMILGDDSILDSIYFSNYPNSKHEKYIEEIRAKLPDKLKELPLIAYSIPFIIDKEQTIKMIFETDLNKLSKDDKISYLLLSSDGAYDFEGSTYLDYLQKSVNWTIPVFNFYRFIGLMNRRNLKDNSLKDLFSDITISKKKHNEIINDTIDQTVSHLSKQSMNIMIKNSEHLDKDREFISNIYKEVCQLDNIWSETIPSGHYLRVTFEKPLDNTKDITLYSRTVSGTPRVEIYEPDKNEIIAEFQSLVSYDYNKVYLSGLKDYQDTFDLKILNGEIEIDYIVDPNYFNDTFSNLTYIESYNNMTYDGDGNFTVNSSGGPQWENIFSETFPNVDLNWEGDDEGDTHQDEYWFVSDTGDTNDIAVDSTDEGTLSPQPNPPALHIEDFDDVSQWVEARADSGLNYWNPSSLNWNDGYINFTYAWYADTGEGIQFWSWNGTSAELQWYEYSGGTNQEHEWDTYSWQLPQWVLDETEFAFRFEILGTGGADEVYVDDVTLDVEIDYPYNYDGNITSVNITKPSFDNTTPYTAFWDKFYAEVNNTTNSTFSILDNTTGSVLLSGLNGDGDDISSLTNDTIKIFGSFNDTVKLGSWNVSWLLIWSNNDPVNSNPNPPTGSIIETINPTLSIEINDADYANQTVNVTFRTNASGPWADIGSNNSVDPTASGVTLYQTPSNMDTYGKKYWWSVNTSDGEGGWDNDTYYFKIKAVPIVFTNTSTGVEETNATLWGWLENNGTFDTECGFWYDTVSGGTTNNYSAGTIQEGDTFNYNAQALSQGQLYYYKAWANNTIRFNNTANEETFLTKPNPPTNLNAKTNSTTKIYLTWDTGTGYNTTYIERNASGDTVWERGTGTIIYNSSGTNYEDTGLIEGTTYYYQAWTYANWTYDSTTPFQWSDNNDSDNSTTNIRPTQTGESPTNQSASISTTPNLYVICSDADDNDLINATWWSNSSGTWKQFGSNNTSFTSGTNITQTNTNFSNYNTTYYWSVNLTDGRGGWRNETYHFTTELIETTVDTITPYVVTSSPLSINATGPDDLDNVTLYYRYSEDNTSWDIGSSVDTGTFTVPGSGDTTVSGLAADPKGVFFWGTQSTSNGSNQVDASYFYGFSDGSNHRAVAATSDQGANNQWRTITTSYCVYGHDPTSETVNLEATCSMGTNSFTISYNTRNTGQIIHYMVFGGEDCSAYVNHEDVDGASSPHTGVGFTPELMLLATHGEDIGTNNQYTFLSLGAAHDNGVSVDQWSNELYFSDNAADNKHSLLESGHALGQLGAEYTPWEITITDMVSDQFSWSEAGSDGGDDFIFMCLDFSDADVSLGTFEKTTDVAPATQSLPDLGFFPQSYLLATSCELSGTAETADNNARVAVGAYNGNNQHSAIATDQNNDNTDCHQRSNDAVLLEISQDLDTNGIQASGVAQTITDSNPDIIWNPNTATATLIGYFAIEYTSLGFIEWNNVSNPDDDYASGGWNWSFDFPNSTGYYEFYSIGKKTGSTNETAPFTADAICHYNPPSLPIVTTNTSTGVEETNATLRGFLSSNGTLDTTCGFRFGTSSGLYSENFSLGIITEDTEFSNNNGSLTPGQIYYYQAWANNPIGFTNGSEMTFLTKPNPPTNLNAKTNSTTKIYLTWNTGTGYNTTYIERNATGDTVWERGTGTIIYNGSGTNYEDTGLIEGTTYYYQAWTYANWTYDSTTPFQWSDNNDSDNSKTNIRPTQTGESPTNQSTSISTTPVLYVICSDADASDTLNATWWSNSSGTWIQFGSNKTSFPSGTNITQTNSNFTTYQIYWWSVNLTDGRGGWRNETYHFTTELIETSVDTITPYIIASSPLALTATGSDDLDNVTLYYRWSDDNISWGHSGELDQSTPTIDSFVETDMIAETTEFTTDSWSHTCGNYDNDVLVVCFGYENNDDPTTLISTVEYGTNSLIQACSYDADEGANHALSEIWYLLNPPTGTDTVYVNFSSTVRGGWGGSISVYNVKQVAPIVNGSTDIGTPASASTDITTIVNNSFIIDCITEGYDRGSMTAGTGQTEFFDAEGSAFSCNVGGSYELKTTIGTETITQSWGADGYRSAHAVVAFEPTNFTWGNGTNWAEWINVNNPDDDYVSGGWNWLFDFPNSTGYYEFYSIGKKSGSINEIAPAGADAICKYVPATLPIVTTNASTGVEETNATLWGWLMNNGTVDTECGFWWDTVSGGTSNNYSVGTISNNTEFSYNVQGLTPGQLYYFTAWANNSAGFNSSGNEETFLTKPNVTSSLNVQSNSSSIIYLTWTAGDGANTTYIERNTIANWAIGIGIEVYNGSGTNYEDTGLTNSTTYYYQAWSYANWTNPTYFYFSDLNISGSNTTKNKPEITNIYPANDSTGIPLNPIPSLQLNHSDGYQMDITWYWGTDSSTPNMFGKNSTVTNGTYEMVNSNFTTNAVTYYWRVTINDGHGEWTNETYHFTTIAGNKIVLSKSSNAYSLEISPTGTTLYGYINSNSVSASIDTEWHYVSLSYDGANIRLYKDGELVDTTGYIGSINKNENDLTIGSWLTGTLDEIRVSNTQRSLAWINTTYQNTNSPTTFAIFGSEVGILKTWTYRKQIWINASLIENDLPYFPVLISTTDTDLKNNALSTGNDIIFTNSTVDWTTSSYTDRLPHEVEFYNDSTGEIIAWVNVTSLSSTTNTSIFMYYGNTLCTSNRENPHDVWDTGYEIVWHLKESGSGNIDEYKDSTANGINGTGGLDNDSGWSGDSAETPSRTSNGKIGYGQDFDDADGANGDKISSTNISSAWSAVTGSVWIYADSAEDDRIWGKTWGTGVTDNTINMRCTGTGAGTLGCRFQTDTSNTPGYEPASMEDGEWIYLVLTWDGSGDDTVRIYKNGVLQGSGLVVSGSTLYGSPPHEFFTLGNVGDGGNNRGFDGIIDEARMSSVVRNTSWINTTYNNTNNTNIFLEFGQQEIKNVAPALSSPSPSNGAMGVSLIPSLTITVNDTNADVMNVTFYTNVTGSWGLIGYNESVYNGTYSQTNDSMNNYNTKYWWSVNVTDYITWTNVTYSFTTSVLPAISGETPTNNSAGISIWPACNVTVSDADGGTVDVYFYENTTGTWVLQQTNSSVDVTSPANVIWSNFTNASQPSTKYNWSVHVFDGVGWTNETYYFTTAASPFLYLYKNYKFTKLSDFLPRATTSDKEYTQFIDITDKVDVINGKLLLKITEELDETTYLDRIYLRVDGNHIIEISNMNWVKPIIEPSIEHILALQINKQLLKSSDNNYLIMKIGDQHLLEFFISNNYSKIEFVSEGYFIKNKN